MTPLEIEQRILELLADGPMLQVDIAAAFPLDMYIDMPKVLRGLEARGLVSRERCGRSKMVRMVEHEVSKV